MTQAVLGGPSAGARLSRRAILIAIAVVSFGAVALALVSQHVFDMQPCPWCALQRLIFVGIGLTALLGLVWDGTLLARRAVPLLLLLLCGCGIASALWQHFVAAASASCNLTLADRVLSGSHLDELLPEVFQPRATCADAAVDLIGVPYEFWSLALFLVIEAAALWLFIRARRVAD
ncbi:MAG TPA: disulfide bond formation protein B [Burkholderiaceae bacterium]|nr:disulfide bond formation protein B [Burkholderiaceae bacterium]